MNYEEKVEKLRQKLNGPKAKLSLEELTIIKYNHKLMNLFIKACAYNKDYITEDIFDDLVEQLIQGNVDLTEPEREQLWYNIAYYLLFVKREYSSDVLYQVVGYANVNEETANKILALREEFYKLEDLSPSDFELNDETFSEILDYKRYDVVSKLKTKWQYTPSPEIIDRLMKEYPFDEYPYPEILIENRKSEIGEVLINLARTAQEIDELRYSISSESKVKQEEYEDYKEKFFNRTKEELIRLGDLYYLDDFTNLNLIFNTFTKEQKEQLNRILFDNNCFYYCSSFESPYLTDEDYIRKFRELVSKDLDITPQLSDAMSHEFMETDEYINYLAEKGNLNLISSFYYATKMPEEIKRKIVSKIVDEIKKGNPNYDYYYDNVDADIIKNTEIINAFIETGKIKSILLYSLGEKELSELITKLFEFNPKVVVYFDYYSASKDIMCQLLSLYEKSGNYRSLAATLLSLIGEKEKYKDVCLQYMENLYIASYLAVSKTDEIISDTDYMNCYLKNDLLIDALLERINHDEKLTYFYNHDNFELLKDTFVRKYNLNGLHLKIMEELLGPTIIRYIENENIQDIINLNDDEFLRIVKLFPKTEFTMNDVQAAYDSLIQNMFAKQNPSIISIYGTFIQALDQNNIEVINTIKEILIENTSIDFMARVEVDFGLPDFSSPKELVEFLIKAYYTDKDETKTIIHALTNEYILNKRKEFHNTHYYAEKYPDEFNIFNNLVKAIEEDNYLKKMTICDKLVKYMSKGFFKEFTKNKDIPEEYLEPRKLLEMIIEKISDPEKKEKYLPLLKEITDYYLSRKQEERSKELEVAAELDLPYGLEETSTEKLITKYIIAHCFDFAIRKPGSYYEKELYDYIIEEARNQGIDELVAKDCIFYYNDPKTFVYDIDLVKKTMKQVIDIATNIINNNIFDLRMYGKPFLPDGRSKVIEKLDNEFKLRRLYSVDPTNIDIYQVLAEINIPLLRNNVIHNEEVYQKLVNLMQKRKLHLLPPSLNSLIEKCNISFDPSNISAFINFFATILQEEQRLLESCGKDPNEALTSLATILTRAETYSSLSSVYSQVLGSEDSKLIKSNPGPNSAYIKLKNNQRLIEGIEYTINNYKRQEITIPPFDETFDFKDEKGNNKQLNIIVGNFTDPCNITHGERTGACMRIGGVGETLFQFCLTNPNGFHIRFEDPETHEYISRVSGFRNGNTVFLNELRYSCNSKKYSNDDVVIACKLAAKRLIELSKDSPCPIENVVIAKQYAISGDEHKEVNLNVRNIKEGLPGFYTDVGSKAVVLATTATDREFAPVNLNKSKVPTYQPCRGKIEYISKTNDLINKVNRVASIKEILNGKNYEDVDKFEFPKGIVYGIVADDWYIYLDRELNVMYDYIPIDPRAKEELATHLQIIEEMLTKKEIKVEEDDYVLQ